MNNPYFEVTDKGIFLFARVKGLDNVYEDRLIISKEAFVEAYNKYIKEAEK